MLERESNDRDVPCYLLPEDSQLRLAKLRDYMDFLSRLAQPRTWDEEQEWAPEVPVSELSICLELLAEQAELVLGEMSWSAQRQVVARAAGHDGDREAGPDADPNAEPDAELEAEPDAELEAVPEVSNAAGKRLVFGLTVAQVDTLDRLLRTISAHGDVLAISETDELADGTVPTLGQAIHDAATEAREILDQLGAQRLVPLPRPRTGVGEARNAYAVAPWSFATDGAWDSMLPLPAHRLLVGVDRRVGARLH